MSIERRVTRRGQVRWVARIKHKGALVDSKTFPLKADAEEWEREQKRALSFGQFIPSAQSATSFSTVADRFLEARKSQVTPHTWRTDRDNLANIPTSWANRPIGAIKEREILRHLTDQLATKARSTVQRARTTLSALFAFAVRERLLNTNPVLGVSMPKGEIQSSEGIETFTDYEFTSTVELQSALRPRLAEVTEFIGLTGLRWSEIRALRVADLQEVPFKAIRVSRAQSEGYAEKGTKTMKPRKVPLTARAWEIAVARTNGRRARDYLFTTKTGLQLRANTFRRFLKWGETAHGHTIHGLRHYAASHWLRAGIPVHQVAAWLGHANPNVTLRVYAHVLGESQDIAAIAKLDEMQQQSPGHSRDTRTEGEPSNSGRRE